MAHTNMVHRQHEITNSTNNNFINIAAVLVIGVVIIMVTLLGTLYDYDYLFIMGFIGLLAVIVKAIMVAAISIADAGKAIAELLNSYRNYKVRKNKKD